MADDVVRVYAYIFADFSVGQIDEADWQALTQAARGKPLAAAIIAASKSPAHTHITANKRSQNATYYLLYTMLGFEIDRDAVDAILIVLDEQAVIHGVSGWNGAKFEGVLTAELREAAGDLGYGATAQSKLSVTLINAQQAGTFSRASAIAQAQAYLAANAAIWYE